MRFWHSLYELFKGPIEAVFIGVILMGIGNLATNNAFSTLYTITNPVILNIATIMSRTGMFIVVNFPLFFMMRIVTRKSGSGTTMLSALLGYAAFLTATMVIDNSSLPATAFSSILGISMTRSMQYSTQYMMAYPLQTGMFAALITVLITIGCFARSKKKSEYSFFGFISKSSWCMITTLFWCAAAGVLTAFAWPYFFMGLQKILDFIAVDTTNPINLALYGITERLMNVLNLGGLVRAPFWYSNMGGSWVSVSGSSVVGDVTIWTAQSATNAVSGMTGRFITPYYILNIFAIPALLWGIFSVQTDKPMKRRSILLFVIADLVSMFTGILLPVEIALFVLCPVLFLMHVGLTGTLFALLQSMQIYLGYNMTAQMSMTAMPGTLMEAFTYISNPVLRPVLIKLLIIGVIMAVVYFCAARLYFRHMAIDLFHTGVKEDIIKSTVKAVGGIDNIRLVTSTYSALIISLQDPYKLDAARLRKLGAVKIMESTAGFKVSFGAQSTMIRMGIQKQIKETVRTVTA